MSESLNDYSSYSTADLLDVKRHIRKAASPENYDNLMIELDRRKDEIEAMQVKEKKSFPISPEKQLKILAYLQLLAALIIGYMTAISSLEDFSLVSCSVGILAVALNGLSGYYLLKKHENGYQLSLANQCFQLVNINTGTFVYQYSGLGGVYAYLSDGIGITANYDPGFMVLSTVETGAFFVGVDLLAVYFVLLLSNHISPAVNKPLNNDAEDTGAC